MKESFWKSAWPQTGLLSIALAIVGIFGTLYFPSIFGHVTNDSIILEVVLIIEGVFIISFAYRQERRLKDVKLD